MNDEKLAGELRALGRTLDLPAPDPATVAVAVLERIAVTERIAAEDGPDARAVAEPAPVMRRRRVRVVAAAVALLVALVLTPPVRAVVADWFGFAGVVVRPGPSESSAPPAPPAESGLTLATARDLVEFEPVVPARLGPPDGVEVSADRRQLTLTWDAVGATVRLDEFDGRLSPRFGKQAVVEETAHFLDVAGAQALWLSEPHEIVVLDENGAERTESARVSGPTLVWQAGDVTLRLEGLDRQHAVGIAESATRPGTR